MDTPGSTRRIIRRRRELEGSELVLALGGDPQRRPARCDDPKLRAAPDEPRHIGSGRHDLLEVVEQQQRLPVADQRDHAIAERPFLRLLHVQGSREGRDEAGGIRDLDERHERDAVQELGREHPPELDEHAGLPDAARAP